MSPTWIEVEVDPEEAETKVGLAFRLKVELFASVKVSTKVKPVKLALPVFSIEIVYIITSPASVLELLFTSETVAV